MTHAEILAKAEAWRRGELSPPEKIGIQGHLEACPACRELVEKWPEALPKPGLAGRVMSRLDEARDIPARGRGWAFAPLAAGLAAVFLIVAAFWHPERKWLDEDKYFTRFDHSRPVGKVQDAKEKFYE